MITLSLFVENKLNELGLSRRQLVDKLGYANIYKGYALLDKIAKGNMIVKEQAERLATALEIDIKELREPLLETQRLCEEKRKAEEEEEKEKARAKFKPFIIAVGENERPEPVFVACLMHKRRFIYLENSFLDLPAGEQLERISNLIGEHMETNKGGLPAFGFFTHYVYRRSSDEDFKDMLYFDTRGELIVNPSESIRGFKNASCSLKIGGKKGLLDWLT